MPETPSEIQQNGEGELKITVPRFLQRWIRLVPKSLLRAFLLFIALGIGFGAVLVISHEAISWLGNRPIPPKVWPVERFDQVGIAAKLETEWNDGIHCKLIIRPLDSSKADDFGRLLSENRYRKITVNLYNSTHFRIWDDDEAIYGFTRIQNGAGKTEGAVREGCLGYLPRDVYSKAVIWEVSTDLPRIASSESTGALQTAPPSGKGGLPQAAQQNSKVGRSSHAPLEGDDVVSGYSVMEGNLETSGGLTFFIYKDGERDNAIGWGVQSARIHYQCDSNSLCTLTRAGTPVVLHAKLRR